jgi:phospholipase D-like protein
VTNRTTRVGIYNLWDKAGRNQGIYCHAKVHMFDAGLLAIGSANVNRRSYLGDSELVAAISDPDVVKQHQQDLWRLLFGNTTIAWPGADLSAQGAGQTFLAAWAEAVAPLGGALDSPAGFAALIGELGWNLAPDAGNSITAIFTNVSTAITDLENLAGSVPGAGRRGALPAVLLPRRCQGALQG